MFLCDVDARQEKNMNKPFKNMTVNKGEIFNVFFSLISSNKSDIKCISLSTKDNIKGQFLTLQQACYLLFTFDSRVMKMKLRISIDLPERKMIIFTGE